MRGEGRRLGFLTRIWAIAWKDILAELRAREMVLSMFLFGFLVILIFNFGIEPGLREMNLVRPGVFWSAFIFAGMLGLNRSFAGEKENDCLQGLLLCPVDRAEIYVGKFLANCVFTIVMGFSFSSFSPPSTMLMFSRWGFLWQSSSCLRRWDSVPWGRCLPPSRWGLRPEMCCWPYSCSRSWFPSFWLQQNLPASCWMAVVWGAQGFGWVFCWSMMWCSSQSRS